jgi:pimeloyl-ACP methyl ester carboxylesterase
MPEHVITAPDGRALKVFDAGDPAGAPVLFHHGTPSSGLLSDEWSAVAAGAGVRLLAYDRPGYGESDRNEGRSVADCAQDVRAIAAALQLPRLGTVGLSGGGPHALACAALLPDLVPAAVTLAAVAPFDAEGLDYFEGTGELNVEDGKLFLSDREAARRKAQADRLELLKLTAPELIGAWESILPEVDQQFLTGRFGEFTVEAMRRGLAPSDAGYWDDNVAFMEPWGFQVSSIEIPVRLRQGRHDLMVPYGHGAWLASQIPSAEPILTEHDGHLTLLGYLAEDLAWLKARLGADGR